MRLNNRLLCLMMLASAPLATGCTNAFFADQILDYVGPTTAVAVAGNPVVANSGQTVLLNGSGSFQQYGSGRTIDAVSAGFTFLWEVTQTPSGAVAPTLTNETTSQASFAATTVGTYVVTLTVANSIDTDSSSVTIQVQ